MVRRLAEGTFVDKPVDGTLLAVAWTAIFRRETRSASMRICDIIDKIHHPNVTYFTFRPSAPAFIEPGVRRTTSAASKIGAD
jgi:hypothetical protein